MLWYIACFVAGFISGGVLIFAIVMNAVPTDILG